VIRRDVLARYLEPGIPFVETGTREGNTVALALELGITKIYTIELDHFRVIKARERFAGQSGVEIFHGSSDEILPTILKELIKPAVFWLDAHGFGTVLMEELKLLAQAPCRQHTLLVDDVRLFPRWKLTLDEVKRRILDINRNYTLHMEDGFTKEDILVATA
jgi:hypothetical protein